MLIGAPRLDVDEMSQPSLEDVTVTSSVPRGRPCSSTANRVGVRSGVFCAPETGTSAIAARQSTRLLRWRKGCVMSRITDEYRTVSESAGWIDRRDRGRLTFEGRDA